MKQGQAWCWGVMLVAGVSSAWCNEFENVCQDASPCAVVAEMKVGLWEASAGQ